MVWRIVCVLLLCVLVSSFSFPMEAPSAASMSLPFHKSLPDSAHEAFENYGLGAKITHIATMKIRIASEEGRTEDASAVDDRSILEIALFGELLPKATENFIALCTHREGYGYVETQFHRVVRNFIIQGGDFTSGDGHGGHSIFNDKGKFEDESFELLHKMGSVAMAAEEKDSNGSQFYILLVPSAPFLDFKHVVFGHVLKGFHTVVRKIATFPTDHTGRPIKFNATITECSVENHNETARVAQYQSALAEHELKFQKQRWERQQQREESHRTRERHTVERIEELKKKLDIHDKVYDGEEGEEEAKGPEGPRNPTDRRLLKRRGHDLARHAFEERERERRARHVGEKYEGRQRLKEEMRRRKLEEMHLEKLRKGMPDERDVTDNL